MKLSPPQERAARRTGQDVCTVAGPGSGKTRTLIGRYAWLIEQSVAPERILAITFTEKAALEIKSRLMERFRLSAEIRQEIERAPVSTIHGFCARLLKENAIAAGVDPQFRVLDEREAALEQRLCLAATLDRITQERRSTMRLLLDGISSYGFEGCLLGLYDSLRLGRWGGRIELKPGEPPAPLIEKVLDEIKTTAGLAAGATEAVRRRAEEMLSFAARRPEFEDPLEWLAQFKISLNGIRNAAFADGVRLIRDSLIPAARQALLTERFQPARELVRDILAEFHHEYSARKRQMGALDFSDLEEQALALLEGDTGRREELRRRYDAILMDELQDTNPVQWSLVNLLRREDRFFAVGDVNQSIYGFRHAAPELFSGYQESLAEAGKVVDELDENYRTRPGILEFVERLVPLCEGLRSHRLQPCGTFPPREGPQVEVLRAEGGASEAEWIAARIRALAGGLLISDGAGGTRLCRFGDIGVLARNTKVFAELEGALLKFDVPYRVVGAGRNFFEEPEIIDLTNWLRLLEDRLDEISAFALLRSPFYSIGDEELFALRRSGRLAPAEIEAEWEKLRALRAETPLDLLLARQIDASGYAEQLTPQGRANVDKFLALLREWASHRPAAIPEWLAIIDDLCAGGREPTAPLVEDADAVQLLSVHRSKGLEFPVVFVVGLHKKSHSRGEAVMWSSEWGLGFSWLDSYSGETRPDRALEKMRQQRQGSEAAEGDRLLYVAVTRAEEHLALTWTLPAQQRPPWPERIEQALELEWEHVPPDVAVERNGVRVLRVTGAPETPPPRVGDADKQALYLTPLESVTEPASGYRITDVTLWAECPRRYLLDRVVGWSEVEPSERASAGSEVHEILARGGEHPFWETDLGKRIRAARRDEAEYDFVFAHRDVVFRGAIDRWFEDEQGGAIVDFKTGMPRPGHDIQLQLYALGVPRAPREAFLVYLKTERVEAVPIDRNIAEQALDTFLDAARRPEWPLREGPHCPCCPHYQASCPTLWTTAGAS